MSRTVKTIKIILLIAGVLYFVGCHNVNWNWSDNRKRIKPKLLLNDEFRESRYYKELFDIVVWNLGSRRYAGQQKFIAQDPNLPFQLNR